MEREERRKRIINRGTDRMAIITGRRIENLDPNFLKSYSFNSPRHDYLSPIHSRTTSDPVQTNHHDNDFFQDDNHHHHPGEDDTSDTRTKHDENHEELVFALQQKTNKKYSSTNQNSSNFPEKQLINHILSISPKEIHSSIITSEDTRVICSIVVAILVVLSHVNLPHNVVKSKSLIAYRPLYVVLLTDVLIVCARLALYTQFRDEDEDDHKEAKVDDDGENWGGAFKLLEWGLVIHQTLRAVFIDCSFYVAIVVCGLSVV